MSDLINDRNCYSKENDYQDHNNIRIDYRNNKLRQSQTGMDERVLVRARKNMHNKNVGASKKTQRDKEKLDILAQYSVYDMNKTLSSKKNSVNPVIQLPEISQQRV